MRFCIPSGVTWVSLCFLCFALNIGVLPAYGQSFFSAVSCDTLITDSGGSNGSYNNNEQSLYTIYPLPGQVLHYSFSSFGLEENDTLFIFSGTDTSGTFLGVHTGTQLPVSGQSTDSTGALTFYFVSNSSNVFLGWEAHLFCQAPVTCPKPKLTLLGSPQICEGTTVMIVSDIALHITWNSNGSTNDSLNITDSGAYWVTYNDGNGCLLNSDTVTIQTIPLPGIPLITTTSPSSVCPGSTVVLHTNASSGISWFYNNALISGSHSDSLLATQPGNYNVSSSVNGCSSSSSTYTLSHLTAPATPGISPLGNTTFCEGNSVVLVSSSANFNQWFNNGSPIASATSNFYTATLSGQYRVAVTAANGCSSLSPPLTVTVSASPAVPVITAPNGTSACQGTPLTLQSDPGPGLQWYRNNNPISGAIGTTYTALLAGTYKTIVTGSNNCSSSSNTIAITVLSLPPTPLVSVTGSLTSCSNQSLVLTSSAASQNQWLLNALQIPGATGNTYSPQTSGSYRVMVTAANGCTSQSAIRNVTILSNPGSIQTNTSPTACNVNNGSISVQGVSGGTSPYFYSFNAGPFAGQTSFTGLAAGTYTIAVSDANACTGQTTVTVAQASGPDTVLTQTMPSNCGANGHISISGSSGGIPPYQYAFGNQSFSSTMLFTGLLPGSYPLQVRDANACISSFSISVGGTPPAIVPQFSTSDTALCPGDTLLINTIPSVPVLWNNGALANQLQIVQGGTYSAVYTDQNNCSSSTPSLTIAVLPAAQIPVISPGGSAFLCPGSTLTLSSNLTGGNFWNGSTEGNTLSINSPGSYWIEQVNSSGCRANSDTLTVVPGQLPDVPVVVQQGDTLWVGSPESIQWFALGGSQVLSSLPYLLPTQSGEYFATATNSEGCSISSNPYPYISTGTDVSRFIQLNGYSLMLKHPGVATLRVYDPSGRLFVEKRIQGNASPDYSLQSLTKGFYFVECIVAEKRITFAFSKNTD